MKNSLLCFVLAFALCGCLSPKGSHVVTGKSHPVISPDAVQIFPTVPGNAEIVGTVNSTAYGEKQPAHDKAISLLKIEAAKIGANGLVVGSPTVGDWGSGTLAGPPLRYSAQAIFVP